MLRDDPNNGREAGCLPSDFFFFFSGWTGSFATGEFSLQFSSRKWPACLKSSWRRHGSVYVLFSSQSAELINFSVISRTTCLIMCSCDILLVHRMPISLNWKVHPTSYVTSYHQTAMTIKSSLPFVVCIVHAKTYVCFSWILPPLILVAYFFLVEFWVDGSHRNSVLCLYCQM